MNVYEIIEYNKKELKDTQEAWDEWIEPFTKGYGRSLRSGKSFWEYLKNTSAYQSLRSAIREEIEAFETKDFKLQKKKAYYVRKWQGEVLQLKSAGYWFEKNALI